MHKNLHSTDLRLLRVFHAVVRHKGFAAAETVLNVGQSTISSHIKDLEVRFGFKVCERGRGGFRLTPAGQRLFDANEGLQRDLAKFSSIVSGIADEIRGSVRIGIPTVLSRIPILTGFHNAIRNVKREYPSINVNVHLDTQREIENGIIDGRYDLALSGEHFRAKQVIVRPLFKLQLRLYCAKSHPLAKVPDSEITPALLLKHDSVMHMYDAPKQKPFFDVSNSLTTESSDASIFYILSGAYIGYMSSAIAGTLEYAELLHPINPSVYYYNARIGIAAQTRTLANPVVQRVMESIVQLHDSKHAGNESNR